MPKKEKRAYEVLTLVKYSGGQAIKRYIVISSSTTKAVSMIQLGKGEEFLEAKELTHEVVLK